MAELYDVNDTTGYEGTDTETTTGGASADDIRLLDQYEQGLSGAFNGSSFLDRWMTNGQWDFVKLAKDGMTVAGAIKAFSDVANQKPIGYQGGIPKYVAMRAQVPQGPAAEARPGAGGNRYFTDTLYTQRPTGFTRPTYEQGLGTVQAQADTLARRGSNLAGPVPQAPVASGLGSWVAPAGAGATPTAPVTGGGGGTDFAASPEVSSGAPGQYAGSDAWQEMLKMKAAQPDITPTGPKPPSSGPAENYEHGFVIEPWLTPGTPEYEREHTPEAIARRDAFYKSFEEAAQNQPAIVPKTTQTQQTAAPVGLPTVAPESTGLAAGGSVGRYLDGDTDGMSDEVPAEIEGNEPAALSHGEYVIPADVVSHLGNGNTKAGVKVLDQFLSRVREERTGNPEQGKEINADKLLPKFAAGGAVRGFAEGAAVTPPAAGSNFTGMESNLSNWAGEYVTDMLGKGQALSELPYEAYQGPLTAGPSALQTQGFNAAANATALPGEFDKATTAGQQALTDLQGLSYDPTKSAIGLGSYTDQGIASKYMSPYMSEVIARQQQDAQRQADIANVGLRSQQAKSGMFGGSRGAIAEAEASRALASQKGDIMAKGLQAAYEQGANQFNQEQGRSLSAQQANQQNTQFGANYGLQAAQAGLQGASTLAGIGQQKSATNLAGLNALLGAGQQQRGIEQEGITADYNAFNQEQMHPYKMVQFQQSLLQGLPLSTQSYNYQTNPWGAAAQGAGAVATTLGGAKQ